MPFQSANRVLAGLPLSDFAMLAASVRAVTLPSGARPLPPGHVYFPHDGVLSLLASTPDGQTIEVASSGREGLIGAIAQADGLLVAALGTVGVSQIPAARLEALAAESDAVERAIGAGREALLRQLRQNLLCGGLHLLERRLSRWLLETADRLESAIVPVTQEMVAHRLGVRRTSVTSLAGKLQEIGAIRWGRSRVEILDRARLEPEACSCWRPLGESLDARRARDLSQQAQRHVGA
jgi:CRP-like cAMP-binding protein